jgi:hypothetical protein
MRAGERCVRKNLRTLAQWAVIEPMPCVARMVKMTLRVLVGKNKGSRREV